MIARLLCAVGLHAWSPWYANGPGPAGQQRRVCTAQRCRGRTVQYRQT